MQTAYFTYESRSIPYLMHAPRSIPCLNMDREIFNAALTGKWMHMNGATKYIQAFPFQRFTHHLGELFHLKVVCEQNNAIC